ncbi:MAG: GDP-mannose 4,6-dehydratase [Anaerolineaceae bacterium]|nr:GDP-mannose 4,6-dehydratase [Anaerolineaceae bacterium]
MSNYLVSGAAGFIASRVSELLIADGHTVVGVDNLNDAYDVRMKHWRLARLKKLPNFKFHEGDICDLKAMEQLFAEQGPFQGVFNLAARAGVRYSVENPWVYVNTNMTGTLNMLEMSRRYNTPKFILASTSSLYGDNNPVPFKEEADTNHPLSPYAASKKGAEAMCYTYHHLYGLDVTVFRYFTVYGPAGRPDMSLFRFAQWICEGRPVQVYGDGNQSRDFTYVDDIARGTILGLKPLQYQVINLGNDHPHALIDVIHILEQKLGRPAKLVYGPVAKADVRATRASIDKARQLLGWQPGVSLEEGLGNLVDWYLQEREWASQIETL